MLIPFQENPAENILPFDGDAYYYRQVFSQEVGDAVFDQLLHTIDWKQDEIIMFGKKIITKRKVGWYGDLPFVYTYSHSAKKALPWNDVLKNIKSIAEKHTGKSFNSCLLNLYHDGQEGMSWHSDDEDTLEPDASIVSISFGAARKFSFQHKTNKTSQSILLENGSLLVMESNVQKNWLHALPKSKRISSPRINLTFRTMKMSSLEK
jgi:alkylated DNA repair dioxygenase AlkB